MQPMQGKGTMTLKEFEDFFNSNDSLSSRNEKTKTITRDILVFGKTQREAADDNNVIFQYVNFMMRGISKAYKQNGLPPGYVLLENVVLPARAAQNVLKLAKKTTEHLKNRKVRSRT